MIASRRHTQKKKIVSTKFVAISLAPLIMLSGIANTLASSTLTESVEQLVQNVEAACPVIWEDLGEKIESEVSTDLWDASNTSDSAAYIAYHTSKDSTPEELTEEQKTAALSNNSVVIADCTSARTALLSKFYSNLPQDVVAAMADLNYEPGEVIDGFEVGDIRYTGRQTAADGWIFLHGEQTVGSAGSGATYSGDEYRALFELASQWHIASFQPGPPEIDPVSGLPVVYQIANVDADPTVWGNNFALTLPDMNGKVIAGGSNADLGKEFGQRTRVISLGQLPTHNHTASNAGNHNHAMGNDTHSHRIRASAYVGSATARAGWDYFGQSRPRPGYQHTYKAEKTILNDTHKHSLTAAPKHTHVINNAGSSQPLDVAQPSIYFRVEMKYK